MIRCPSQSYRCLFRPEAVDGAVEGDYTRQWEISSERIYRHASYLRDLVSVPASTGYVQLTEAVAVRQVKRSLEAGLRGTMPCKFDAANSDPVAQWPGESTPVEANSLPLSCVFILLFGRQRPRLDHRNLLALCSFVCLAPFVSFA